MYYKRAASSPPSCRPHSSGERRLLLRNAQVRALSYDDRQRDYTRCATRGNANAMMARCDIFSARAHGDAPVPRLVERPLLRREGRLHRCDYYYY